MFTKEAHALLSHNNILDNMFIEIATNMKTAKAIDLQTTNDNSGIRYEISTICMPDSDYNNFRQLVKRLRMRYPEDSDVFYLAKFVGLTDMSKMQRDEKTTF